MQYSVVMGGGYDRDCTEYSVVVVMEGGGGRLGMCGGGVRVDGRNEQHWRIDQVRFAEWCRRPSASHHLT